jgi:hypothetical protein
MVTDMMVTGREERRTVTVFTIISVALFTRETTSMVRRVALAALYSQTKLVSRVLGKIRVLKDLAKYYIIMAIYLKENSNNRKNRATEYTSGETMHCTREI